MAPLQFVNAPPMHLIWEVMTMVMVIGDDGDVGDDVDGDGVDGEYDQEW